MPDSPETVDPLPLLDELRAMAQTGLHFADDPYDEERYERILDLVSEYYGTVFELPPGTVRDRLEGEIGEVTPKVAAIAAVFDDRGRLLVIKRTDDRTWCMPGGKLNVGESPEEAAVREVREETDVEVTVAELVGTYAVEPPSTYPHHGVVCLYRCVRTAGEPGPSLEAEVAEYRQATDVPAWSAPYYPDQLLPDGVTALRNATGGKP